MLIYEWAWQIIIYITFDFMPEEHSQKANWSPRPNFTSTTVCGHCYKSRTAKPDTLAPKYRSHIHFPQHLYHWTAVYLRTRIYCFYLFWSQSLLYGCQLTDISLWITLWSPTTWACICSLCTCLALGQEWGYERWDLLRDHRKVSLKQLSDFLLMCGQASILWNRP